MNASRSVLRDALTKKMAQPEIAIQRKVPDLTQTNPSTLRILQISDLHFGPPFIENIGASVLVLARQLAPSAVVVSGDLTQRAKREQFLAARDFLAQLPDVPRLVIPGNHDVPLYRIAERVLAPHGLYREIICQDLNPVLRLEGAVLAGLDSTAPHSAISNGRIFQSQLDACARTFATVPADALRVVVAHHHFAPAPDYLRDSTMPGSRRAMRRFADLGVDLILGGHLHRAFIGNSLDFYPGSHRERGIIIVQCGTTTSQRGRGRERQKNSCNLIDVSPAAITITHFMFFHECSGFQPVSRHTFRRGPVTGADENSTILTSPSEAALSVGHSSV